MDPSLPTDVTAADVLTAHRRLRALLAPTPVLLHAGRDAILKLENLQVTGAYKVRGAVNAIAAAVERGDRRPVIVASAGNHGKGVAWAARAFGLACRIVVPESAPEAKVAGARALGAEVVRHGAGFEAAAGRAMREAVERGWRFIHPFDDPDVIAGQGSVAVELDPLEPGVVVVPIGGGGLAAGMSLHFASRGVRVIGAQVEGVDGMHRALRGLRPAAPARTIADGLAVREPGARAVAICRALLDDVVLVPEALVRRTMHTLAWHDKLVVEGAGAVAVAALAQVPGTRRVAVVSGGNLDPALLQEPHAA